MSEPTANRALAAASDLAGWLALKQTTEALRLAPSVDEFYWRFYVPLVDAVLDEAAR